MPAIQAEACLRSIYAIRTDHLAQTGIGRRKGLILMGLRIFKIIRAAEIILRARAADGGIFPVAVHVELDLSLTPPAGVVHTPGHVGADILPSPANAIQNRIILLIGQWIDPAELRMKIARVLLHRLHGIGNLIIDGDALRFSSVKRAPLRKGISQ